VSDLALRRDGFGHGASIEHDDLVIRPHGYDLVSGDWGELLQQKKIIISTKHVHGKAIPLLFQTSAL